MSPLLMPIGRFAGGPRPTVAEPHLDMVHNFIVVLGGSRRWLLARPGHCVNMHMYPGKHRLARHSPVDWSNPDLNRFPRFKHVAGSEGKWAHDMDSLTHIYVTPHSPHTYIGIVHTHTQ